LTRAIVDVVSVPVIASGGAGTAEHLAEALGDAGADAALVAGILHDRETTVRDIKNHLTARGIGIRSAA
jgi:cyclase